MKFIATAAIMAVASAKFNDDYVKAMKTKMGALDAACKGQNPSLMHNACAPALKTYGEKVDSCKNKDGSENLGCAQRAFMTMAKCYEVYCENAKVSTEIKK